MTKKYSQENFETYLRDQLYDVPSKTRERVVSRAVKYKERNDQRLIESFKDEALKQYAQGQQDMQQVAREALKEFPEGKESYCPRCYFQDEKVILREDCPQTTQIMKSLNSSPKLKN